MSEDPEKKAFFKERMDIWMKLFNYGTLPFYLGAYEPEEGKPNWESRMAAASYMKEHGIKAKGHPLCWHTACANWLMQYDNETILKKQLARIERDVTRFKGTIDTWDVINEVVIMPMFDKYDNAITTDENGFVTAEGFKGEYLLTLGDTKAVLTPDKSKEEPEIVVLN